VYAIGAFRPAAGSFVQRRARRGFRDCALGFPFATPASGGVVARGVPHFSLQIKIYYILC
jgi:hypothetical protein